MPKSYSLRVLKMGQFLAPNGRKVASCMKGEYQFSMNLKSKVCFTLATALFSLPLFAGERTSHQLIRLRTEKRNELSYVCNLPSSLEKVSARITINLSNQFMRVDLYEGVRVQGFASSTSDQKTGETVYFLQGGTQPYAQQLTLTIRNGGDWAQFKRTYGGESFICQ